MTSKRIRTRVLLTRAPKKTREAPARMQLVVSERELVARAGARITRIALHSGEERAIKNGELAEARLLTAAVRQAASELGTGKGAVTVALPSQLFQIHVGPLPIPEGVDVRQAVENNIERIYAVRDDEYGSFALVPEISEEPEWRVIYVTARRAHITPYVDAIRAAGVKVIASEPVAISEMRAIASLRRDQAISVISLEEGTARVSELLEGELLTTHAVPALENALLGISLDLREAVQRVAAGEASLLEVNQGPQASQEVLNIIKQNTSYSQSLWRRSDTPVSMVVTGVLDMPGGPEMLNEEMMLSAERIDPSEYVGTLASEGLALRTKGGATSLDINMIAAPAGQKKERSALNPFVLPLAVTLLAAGTYGYAMARQSEVQQKISAYESEKLQLEPRVREQIRLQDENRRIEADLARADEVRKTSNNVASYVQMIIGEMPGTDIGVVSISPAGQTPDKRLFNARAVDQVFKVVVQGRNQSSLMAVIQAFEQQPFAISVESITPVNENSDVRVLRADIGALRSELDKRLNDSAQRELDRRADEAAGLAPNAPTNAPTTAPTTAPTGN